MSVWDQDLICPYQVLVRQTDPHSKRIDTISASGTGFGIKSANLDSYYSVVVIITSFMIYDEFRMLAFDKK